jgi:hypothetical protein
MSNLQVMPQNLPAHLSQLSALLPDNDLAGGMSGGYGVMSIKGSKWRLKEGGEERPIYMPGTTDLAPSIKVVLVKANPNLSKTYYEGGYVEGSDSPPVCSSDDGISPSRDSEKPQCHSCAVCPKNEWGSKITDDGKKGRLCADARRVAILPAEDLNHTPILLRVPAASLQDLALYGKNLNRTGRPYAAVVTKLAFDANAAYPKIVFSYERDLGADEVQVVVDKLNDPIVEDVIGVPISGVPAQQAPAPGMPQTPPPAHLQQLQPAQAQAQEQAAPARARAPRTSRAAAPAPAPAEAAAPVASNVTPLHQPAAVQQPPAQVVDAVIANGNIADDIEAALAGLSM